MASIEQFSDESLPAGSLEPMTDTGWAIAPADTFVEPVVDEAYLPPATETVDTRTPTDPADADDDGSVLPEEPAIPEDQRPVAAPVSAVVILPVSAPAPERLEPQADAPAYAATSPTIPTPVEPVRQEAPLEYAQPVAEREPTEDKAPETLVENEEHGSEREYTAEQDTDHRRDEEHPETLEENEPLTPRVEWTGPGLRRIREGDSEPPRFSDIVSMLEYHGTLPNGNSNTGYAEYGLPDNPKDRAAVEEGLERLFDMGRLHRIAGDSSQDTVAIVEAAQKATAEDLEQLVGLTNPDIPIPEMDDFRRRLMLTGHPRALFFNVADTMPAGADSLTKYLWHRFSTRPWGGLLLPEYNLAAMAVDNHPSPETLFITAAHELIGHGTERYAMTCLRGDDGTVYVLSANQVLPSRIAEARATLLAAHFATIHGGHSSEVSMHGRGVDGLEVPVPDAYLFQRNDPSHLEQSAISAVSWELLLCKVPDLLPAFLSSEALIIRAIANRVYPGMYDTLSGRSDVDPNSVRLLARILNNMYGHDVQTAVGRKAAIRTVAETSIHIGDLLRTGATQA